MTQLEKSFHPPKSADRLLGQQTNGRSARDSERQSSRGDFGMAALRVIAAGYWRFASNACDVCNYPIRRLWLAYHSTKRRSERRNLIKLSSMKSSLFFVQMKTVHWAVKWRWKRIAADALPRWQVIIIILIRGTSTRREDKNRWEPHAPRVRHVALFVVS